MIYSRLESGNTELHFLRFTYVENEKRAPNICITLKIAIKNSHEEWNDWALIMQSKKVLIIIYALKYNY